MFNDIYANRRVLLTGHTGFKGSWMAAWLSRLGAEVLGVSLPLPTEQPNHLELLQLPGLKSAIVDVRDLPTLKNVCRSFNPEIVFHLAAQSLVRLSYQLPIETLTTNVLGTANLLEACRQAPAVKAIVVVTSDKCYENFERPEPYCEHDRMGGHDPYSMSKGCAELVTAAYRRSFFSLESYPNQHQTLVATARAGNVVGGGDWAADRLIPDCVRATARSQTLLLRNPDAIRPWQHVLEPVAGYLSLGEKLHQGIIEAANAWNFGPEKEGMVTVQKAVKIMQNAWPEIKCELEDTKPTVHEAEILKLDCSKAKTQLQWQPVWNLQQTFQKTAEWYRQYLQDQTAKTWDDLDEYVTEAKRKQINWAMK